MTNRDNGLDSLLEVSVGRVFPAVVVQVRRAGQVVYERALGFYDPKTKQQPN